LRFNSEDKLTNDPPKEFPAKLTLWLNQRYKHFKGDSTKGCILLPCELIEDNGVVLKKTILQYADHWRLDEMFKDWINHSNYFCSTLVDRIVSGYPTDRAEIIQNEIGFKDNLLVSGEYYHSWVIKANLYVQKELPFEHTDLNVEFVDDLAPYREMKVRILNGAHTSMVPVAYLAGMRFVKEAMDNEVVNDFVASLLLKEAAITLNFPEEVKNKFVQDVLDRFGNPLLKHQLISISLNSTSKFVSRLLNTLKDFYKSQGKLPGRIVFGLSALIRFYKGEFNGEIINLKDDKEVLDFFSEEWGKVDDKEIDINTLTNNVLSNSSIWKEDLTRIDQLVESVSQNIIQIEQKGVIEALKNLSVVNS
ncbi:UNVERIFIED_CONTAM: hypothetical protein GTU68_031702, partial [Idotea baltica]|nr:hypothetical protein [Idotea baltica]